MSVSRPFRRSSPAVFLYHSLFPSPSTTPNPRPSKPLRLRLACDACTTAKVKCSKTHPCERCLDNDEECRYSASRRHGKRSRHKQSGNEAQQHLSPSSCMVTPVMPTPVSAVECQTVLYDSEFTFAGSTASSTPALLEDWTKQDMGVTFDLDAALYDPTSEEWEMPGPISHASQGQPGKSPAAEGQREVVADHIASQNKLSMLAAMGTSAPGDESRDLKAAHDCETVALRILNSLHDSPKLEHTEDTCRESTGHDAADDVPGLIRSACAMPCIETVLVTNQAALASLGPLLKCPCARSPHIALLHSTILSKAIFWYRMAVAARSHAEGVRLRPMKIRLGMLDLDDDDQATVQLAVLLGELRKVDRVVEAIEKEGPTWLGLAIQKMREELQSIMGHIKRSQSE